MSHLGLKNLTKAEELFDDGKLDEALELLSDWNQLDGLNLQQKRYFQFLKGLIFIYQNKSEEVIKLGERLLNKGQMHNDNLQSFDGTFFIITGLSLAYRFNAALKLIEKAEVLFTFLSKLSENALIKRKVRLNLLKGWINLNINNIDLAEKYLEQVLDSQKELGITFEIIWAYLLMAQILLRVKIRYNLAMEYTKKALSLAEEIDFNHYWIAMSYLYFGRIFYAMGEFDVSLKHLMRSLKLFKRSKNTYWTARVLNTIGFIYGNKGEYQRALEYLEESLLLYEVQSIGVEFCLENLIYVTLEKDDIESAKKYFARLESIYIQKKESHVKLFYQYCKALILKRSTRIRDKAKTEELLKQVIETKTIFYEVIRDALIQLCDILLSEYRESNNSEVLDELKQYIAKLLNIAEKSHSYFVFCETFILQAKLALVNLDVKEARRFLTHAQRIAESKGFKRLAMKISYEHDELLKQLKMWENLRESKTASLTERMKLAGLNEQMEKIVKRKKFEEVELSDEEPVLLLIVSEGGIPFFSHSFIEDKVFEDHLFGGFFTAINSFINEMFSEGFDRASFGKHTLLMKTFSPFLMCYVYKGQSYSAQNRIKSFINEIKSNKEIWNTFEDFYKRNRKIQIKAIPALEKLITKIFIDKNVPINV